MNTSIQIQNPHYQNSQAQSTETVSLEAQSLPAQNMETRDQQVENSLERRENRAVLTVIEKLQVVLSKIEQASKIALERSHAANHIMAGRALVALGLCQQAREQVRAACQNMGFTLDSLMLIDEKAQGPAKQLQQDQLRAARIALVKVLVKEIGVSREAVFISMQAFADESAVMAAILLSRANYHLDACASTSDR